MECFKKMNISGSNKDECCCICEYQIKIMQHPSNLSEYTTGSISSQMGWGCAFNRSDKNEQRSVIYQDNKHGLCECFLKRKSLE